MSDPNPSRLSHYDNAGQASMVDVSSKQPTRRTAVASAFVDLSAAVLAALPQNPKGNPLEVARFAGIQAAKRTSELIPMCHPLPAHPRRRAGAHRGHRRPHRRHRRYRRRYWRRDGSPDRRLRRRPHCLRHDQSTRQSHRHSQHPARIQDRRQKRPVRRSCNRL